MKRIRYRYISFRRNEKNLKLFQASYFHWLSNKPSGCGYIPTICPIRKENISVSSTCAVMCTISSDRIIIYIIKNPMSQTKSRVRIEDTWHDFVHIFRQRENPAKKVNKMWKSFQNMRKFLNSELIFNTLSHHFRRKILQKYYE